MHIYTRLGDQGETSLYTPKGVPQRLSKAHARVEAYGTIDELTSLLGVVRAELGRHDPLEPLLVHLQNRLFHAGYDISTMPQPDGPPRSITPDDVLRLESEIDALQAQLPALQNFVLPSGVRAAALLQLARTVARRAERRVWTLAAQEPVNPHALRYLNRLSDLLFVLARVLARHERGSEVLWRHERT